MSLEFVPPRVMEAMCSGPVPELVRVMILAATATPCVTVPKETLLGVSFTTGVPGGGDAPVPVNCTDWGETGASSLMVRLAVRWPAPSGENVTATLQVEATGYAPEQALATWKSAGFAPLGRTEEMCRVALPALVTVMLCAGLLLPCVVLAKVRLPGARVMAGSGAAPLPFRGIDCGLPGALSAAAKLAWRGPAAVGEKTTLTVQVAFGKRTVGNEQLGVATKSEGLAPVTLTEDMVGNCPPVLGRVTSLELLDWPTVTPPKSSDAGKITATGPLTACTGAPEMASVPCATAPPKGDPAISERAPL